MKHPVISWLYMWANSWALQQAQDIMSGRPKLHAISGTTVYIGRTELATVYGQMVAYTFQDLIHKGYIIGLAHGDLSAPELYTRMHSSCVTSELMRSLDCDCVQQLNGAIRKICSSNGILFYLIQEGRGCGYVGKSRACMTVQYYEEQRNINTFEAYELLGMKHDYREYSNVRDIIKIMEITSKFVLLTNNPDKIEKFSKLGIDLKGVESIEVAPNPFNQTYLHSKQQYGHILFQTKTKIQKYVMPYERVKPFTPYGIPGCERFVHVAQYYLPIKPVDNRILLSEEDYRRFCQPARNSYQLVRDPAAQSRRAYYVQLTQQEIEQNPEHLSRPNWFQINVHYDMVTNQDYLVLRYGSPADAEVPVVRIHSESIFNRFPLVDREYKARYKRSLDYIIRNGYGLILIFYNDGRGSGLGYLVLNTENRAHQLGGDVGVQEDKRDYYGGINLIKHYLEPGRPIDLLVGQTSQDILHKEFARSNILVRKYIKLNTQSQKMGLHSIEQRIRALRINLEEMDRVMDYALLGQFGARVQRALKEGKTVYSTGIGCSESHSKSLESLFNERIKHISPLKLEVLAKENILLVVFSQGMSPNIISLVEQLKQQNVIVITSLSPQHHLADKRKQECLEKLRSNNALILNYPRENPDDTLIRVTGPFLVFYLVALLKRCETSQNQVQAREVQQRLLAQVYELLNMDSLNLQRSNSFIENLATKKNVIICCDFPAINFAENLRFKFIEGAMINCHIIDYANFAHGTFQFVENFDNKNNYCVWFVTKESNKLHAKTVEMLGLPDGLVYTSVYGKEEYDLLALQLEIEANYIIFQLIQVIGVNQHDWAGKERQQIIFEAYSH